MKLWFLTLVWLAATPFFSVHLAPVLLTFFLQLHLSHSFLGYNKVTKCPFFALKTQKYENFVLEHEFFNLNYINFLRKQISIWSINMSITTSTNSIKIIIIIMEEIFPRHYASDLVFPHFRSLFYRACVPPHTIYIVAIFLSSTARCSSSDRQDIFLCWPSSVVSAALSPPFCIIFLTALVALSPFIWVVTLSILCFSVSLV